MCIATSWPKSGLLVEIENICVCIVSYVDGCIIPAPGGNSVVVIIVIINNIYADDVF